MADLSAQLEQLASLREAGHLSDLLLQGRQLSHARLVRRQLRRAPQRRPLAGTRRTPWQARARGSAPPCS